jgi:hypothetical protein
MKWRVGIHLDVNKPFLRLTSAESQYPPVVARLSPILIIPIHLNKTPLDAWNKIFFTRMFIILAYLNSQTSGGSRQINKQEG